MNLKVNIKKIRIQHALDIYEIMQMVLKREDKVHQGKEHFWVLALDNANRILSLELISMGNTIQTIVRPMDVLSIPLQKKAAGVILVHNHPSGKLEPSEKDLDLTDRLIRACALMNTPVLDHVIITTHSYLSFKESGWLERLEGSTKYLLSYELERQYHEEVEAIIQQKERETKKRIIETLAQGRKEGLQEVAKQMLEAGESIEKIHSWTGLSVADIKRLK